MDSNYTDTDLVDAFSSVSAEPADDPGEAPQPTQTANEPEPNAPAAPATSEPPPASDPDPRDTELEELRRVIAADPYKRHAYEMQKYGQSAVDPYQAFSQQAQRETAPQTTEQVQTPWNDDNPFDVTDPRHLQYMLEQAVESKVNPALEYIQQLQQEEQHLAQQRQVREAQEAQEKVEKAIASQVEKYIPGYSDIHSSEQVTNEQYALRQSVQGLFQKEMFANHPPSQQLPDGRPFNPLWYNERVQKEIIDRIGPTVQTMARQLGIQSGQQVKPQTPPQAVYVEQANNVPSDHANPFDKASKQYAKTGSKSDLANAFGAIGYIA